MSLTYVEAWEADAYMRRRADVKVEMYLDPFYNAEDYALMTRLQQAFMSGEVTWLPVSGESIYGVIVAFNAGHPIDGLCTLKYTVRQIMEPSTPKRTPNMICIDPVNIRSIIEVPMLSRRPHLRGYPSDVSDVYELGHLEVSGNLVLELKRSAGVFEAGSLIEVAMPYGSDNTTIWRGTVVGWCYKQDFASCTPYTEITIRPLGGPIVSSNKPITEDTTMKVYDAVVLKLDEKGEVAEIVKAIPAFLAKDAKAAREAVMVDYAIEAKLTGKDLAGFSVRVRCFQEVAA